MAKAFSSSPATGPKPRSFDRGNRSSSAKITTPLTTGPKQIKTIHPQQRPVTKSKKNLV